MNTTPTIVIDVPIASIVVGGRIRRTDLERVKQLADNIADVGLLHPITVFALDDGAGPSAQPTWGLVAGMHRLAAYQQLGRSSVPATQVQMNDHERTIAECDENLFGTKLSPAERAILTKRRKEAYEALHPETRNGGTGRRRGKLRQAGEAIRFTADTAQKIGANERVIQRDAHRGASIREDVMAMVQGTELDRGNILDALAATPSNEQMAALVAMQREKGAPAKSRLRGSRNAVIKSGTAERAEIQ